MGEWVHRILEADPETLTGVCAHCGPVDLKRKNNSSGGKTRYACRTAESRWSKGSRSWKPSPEQQREARERRRERRVGEAAAIWGNLDCCAICARDFTGSPHIDHCHRSGYVRGLICNNCNVAIAMLGDSPEIARAIANYLEAPQSEVVYRQ